MARNSNIFILKIRGWLNKVNMLITLWCKLTISSVFYMLLKCKQFQTKLMVPNTIIFLTLVAFTTVTLLELTQWVQALAAVSTRNIV